MKEMDRLLSSTLNSHPLTHARLKFLSSIAQSTEDHISRVGLALSLNRGEVEPGWVPSQFQVEGILVETFNQKHLKGRTLFKEELALWVALALRHQVPADYAEWRRVMIAHWERGVQELTAKAVSEGDWIRTLRACLPN